MTTYGRGTDAEILSGHQDRVVTKQRLAPRGECGLAGHDAFQVYEDVAVTISNSAVIISAIKR
jgi:hypothetical protein